MSARISLSDMCTNVHATVTRVLVFGMPDVLPWKKVVDLWPLRCCIGFHRNRDSLWERGILVHESLSGTMSSPQWQGVSFALSESVMCSKDKPLCTQPLQCPTMHVVVRLCGCRSLPWSRGMKSSCLSVVRLTCQCNKGHKCCPEIPEEYFH